MTVFYVGEQRLFVDAPSLCIKGTLFCILLKRLNRVTFVQSGERFENEAVVGIITPNQLRFRQHC